MAGGWRSVDEKEKEKEKEKELAGDEFTITIRSTEEDKSLTSQP